MKYVAHREREAAHTRNGCLIKGRYEQSRKPLINDKAFYQGNSQDNRLLQDRHFDIAGSVLTLKI